MKNVSKLVLVGSLLFWVTANAEITEDMKTRAALGLGAGYIASHIIKNNIAENKIVNFVMTGLAMGALSAAYDASQGRGFNAGNTGAAMLFLMMWLVMSPAPSPSAARVFMSSVISALAVTENKRLPTKTNLLTFFICYLL